MEDPNANPHLYRQTLREAWRITWHHKFLWFFGFFAFLLNIGMLSGVVTFVQNLGTVSNQGQIAANAKLIYENQTLGFIWNNVKAFGAQLTFGNMVTLLIIFAIFGFFIWMSVVAQGALIAATGKLRAGQTATPEDSFRQGTKTFWSVLWLNLFRFLITTGLALVLGVPLLGLFLTQGSDLWLSVLMFLNFIIFVPFASIVAFLLQFALANVVLRKQNLKQAIRNAWALFRTHWLATLEMALLLLVVVAIVAYVFSLIFSDNLVEVYVAQSAGITLGFKQYFTVSFVIFLIANVLFNGITVAFNFVVTTLFYLKLQEGGFTARLIRWFGHWGKVGEARAPSLKAVK